jgi:hypothetical protein
MAEFKCTGIPGTEKSLLLGEIERMLTSNGLLLAAYKCKDNM